MGSHLKKAFRELRDELHLSQAEVARRAKDVSRPTVVLMEQGKRVKLETLEIIASVMGATRSQRTGLILAWMRDCLGEDLWREVVSALRR